MKQSLNERKQLHFRCRRVNDIMCIIAVLGVILMIIDAECRFNEVADNSFIFIRPLISISSLVLVGMLLYYHVLDVRLYAINNHIADWRVTLKIRGMVIVILEVIICIIHPLPCVTKSWVASDTLMWADMMCTLPSKTTSVVTYSLVKYYSF